MDRILLRCFSGASIPSVNLSLLPDCRQWICYYTKNNSTEEFNPPRTQQSTNDKEPSPSSPSMFRTLRPTSLPMLRQTSIPLPSSSSRLLDSTSPTGEVSYFRPPSTTRTPPPVMLPSTSDSLSNSPSVLADDAGCPSRALYWALTSWENDCMEVMMLAALSRLGSLVVSILGSAPHACANKLSPHRHWLVKMARQIRESQFPTEIKTRCWIQPITRTGRDTLRDALAKYVNYIKGKGSPLVERGPPIFVPCAQKNQRTKNEEILQMILEGKRCSEICLKYPQLLPQIYKLARFRPQRSH